MSARNKVLAGMEMMAWDVDPGQWAASIQARRRFVERTLGGNDLQSFAHSDYSKYRGEAADLGKEPPDRISFTATGLSYAKKARLWRSTWWHLSHMKIELAGWEALRLKWQHRWGISAREIVFPLPAGAIPHLSDMANTLLARNPFQSEIEMVTEPGHGE